MALTAALILAITSFASCSKSNSADGSSQEASSIVASDIDMKIDASDLEVGYDESSACRITLDGTSASVSGDGAAWKDGVLTISKAGTYILSGKLISGRVLVDAGKNDDVHIVLAGAEITSSDNTAMTVLRTIPMHAICARPTGPYTAMPPYASRPAAGSAAG